MRFITELIAALFVVLTLAGCGEFGAKRASPDGAPIPDDYVCGECQCEPDGSCICTDCKPPAGSCCEHGCDGDDCSMGACDCPPGCECPCGDDGSDDGDVGGGRDPGGSGGCPGGSCFTGAERVRCE